jgi:hypothetical protein
MCPLCRYEIVNPLTDRCPRCLTTVAVAKPACGECVYHSGCDIPCAPKFDFRNERR